MLEEKKVHLPSILQSLGCIAQIAMPIFETRKEEIISFITKKILECNDVRLALFKFSLLFSLLYHCHHICKCPQDMAQNSSNKSEWGDSTQNCLLKVSEIMVFSFQSNHQCPFTASYVSFGFSFCRFMASKLW